MALISPILDDRSYDQLREELLRRIPVYDPEWTDHNESDPGIALLELFAFLGESLLFRFNQIPDTTKVEFLRLLGVRPRPARPASVLLAVTTEQPQGVQVLRGTPAAAGPLGFETDDETYVWPLELIAAGKTPQEPEAGPAGAESSADALSRAGIIDPERAQFYTTTVVSADPLAADAVTVDVSAQVDQALWLALLAKPTTDLGALGGRTVFVGLAFDERIDPPLILEQLAPGQSETYSSDLLSREPPPMAWRLWNGPGATEPFRTVQVIGDTTRGLLTSGVVKVVLPATLPVLDGSTTGGAEAPPPLDDEELNARVIAWLQVHRPAALGIGDAIGPVRWAAVNAVGATQARTAGTELVGTGTGDTDQRYPLAHRPVLAGTVRLQVEEPAGWAAWQEVDTLTASSIADRHFACDLDTGEIVFGRQRFPQAGERIRVSGYRYGGGAAGNVPAGTITAFEGVGGATVAHPLPAAGGADPIRLDEALDAIPAEVHRRDRAVIATDFTDLARQVTGVTRADLLVRFHPDSPGVEAAGVVTLVVIGPPDPRNPDAPLPDLGLLRRVARHLDQRRLVTTELYVIPPEYVPLWLSVGVVVREGYQADAVRRWVTQLLRQYLSPLPPYGPEGAGWPLGRSVRRAELEAVAVQVDGVEYCEDLLLGIPEAGGSGVTPAELIELEPWQLPTIVGLTVSAGPPLPLGTQEAPPAPDKVPVPLPVEVC